MTQVDADYWLDRIDACIDIQKHCQLPIITLKLTENELRELRIVFSSLKELNEK